MTSYRLIGPDGIEYTSAVPGTVGGNCMRTEYQAWKAAQEA